MHPRQQKFFMSNASIFLKGAGCWTCAAGFQVFSTIEAVGFDGMPEYEDFLTKDIWLQTSCRFDEKWWLLQAFSKSIVGREFFNTYLVDKTQRERRPTSYSISADYTEAFCYEKIKNCAICGGYGGFKVSCKMCIDNHMLVNVTQPDGKIEQVCMRDFCPTGFKKYKKMNGISYCKPCEISHCSECTQIQQKLDNHEVCIKCDGQFQLSESKRRCTNIVDYANFQK